MGDQPGFEIKGRFYPFPVSFRMGDPVLVTEMTGLDWPTFADRLDDPDYENDLVMLAGLVSVAIWQKHDMWRRERVVKYVQTLELGALSIVGVEGDEDEDEAEGDAGPPDEAPDGASSSETSPPPSSPTPGSQSAKPSPRTSGRRASATGST